jgi:hypothetical protein
MHPGIGDELIIPALLFETREENVFQSEERQYPVFFQQHPDFDYLLSTWNFRIT